MQEIIDFVTQLEVLGTVGVVGALGLLNGIRKQFTNGNIVALIVTYAGKKLMDMFTSDKPEVQAKAYSVVDTIIATPKMQELFNKVSASADTEIIRLQESLTNVKVKLEVGGWSQEVTQDLIKTKELLQTRLDEINS